MAKQLNQVQVNLQFTADTKQAKQQLEGLQQTLNNLVRNPSGNLDKQMAAAAKSAAELSSHLAKATNQTTGTLDFSKLNQSIQKSGKSISEYGAELLKLGPAGHQAFSQLTTAITNSEIPMRRMSKTLQEMGTVLSNTIRWQISSSAIHAMQGAIQGAYRYAQNLNKSLNDIRIVTGQSAEQMEKFAERANRAAKNLSSTTLDYTNASLIYYQQGLSDEEVEARTNVTIKMANAAGESAEKVSSQLTAVWNNFAKGGENLEYYADVMTALGAATASSTDEISQGLEKFASVADTVGLSYEYAAAALATVTATTRQSADVVGNAFKTLFARLEGLKLGETLDDGTDLNKYSQALSAVGVSIKDTDGELRNMDNILDDLAGKWQNLSKDQKMALAQTVAGVRQYTQLIALMDNWDFMERNIETARNSSGTLQRQADIYAESWEAAQKRVQTALQGVYNALIKDDFFITILNGTEKAITGVNNLIKAFGGLPGILSTIGVVVTQVFSKQLSEGLQNTVYNLRMLIPSEREKVAQEKYNSINKLSDSFYATEGPDASLADKARYQALQGTLELQKAYVEKAKDLNSLEISTAEQLIAQNEARREAVELAASQLDIITKEKDDFFLNNDFSGTTYAVNDITELFNAIEQYKSGVTGSEEELKIHNIAINEHIQLLQEQLKEAKSLSVQSESDKKTKQDLIIQIQREISVLKTGSQIATQEFNSVQNINKALNEASISEKVFLDWLNESRYAAMSWSDAIVQGANSLGQLLRGINSLKGVWNTLNDDNLSFFEKISSATISLSFGLPALIKGFSGAKDSILGFSANILKIINATKALGEVNNIAQASQLLLDESIDASSAAYAVQLTVSKLNISEKEKEILVTKILDAWKAKGTALTEAEIIALIKENTVLKSSIVLKEKLAGITALLNIKYIAIAAAIAAVVAVVYAMVQAYHEAENTAKTLNEQTETLKTRYQELSQSAEDLKNKISNYEEGIASLRKLNSSTDEYKETLKKTNEQAQELIESLGLFGEWTYDNNGAIIIKDLDKYQQQADQQANEAKKSYALGQIQAAQATQRSEMVTGLRNILGPISTSSADNLIKQLTSERLTDSQIQSTINTALQTSVSSDGEFTANTVTQEQATAVQKLITSYQNAADKIDYYTRQYAAVDIENNYRERINALATNADGEIDQTIANAIINVASANINTENAFTEEENQRVAKAIQSGQLSQQDLIDLFGVSYIADKTGDYTTGGNFAWQPSQEELVQKYGELTGQEGLYIGADGGLYKGRQQLQESFTVDDVLEALFNKQNSDKLASQEEQNMAGSERLWKSLRDNNISTSTSTAIMQAIAGDGTGFDLSNLIEHYTDYEDLEEISNNINSILGDKAGTDSGKQFISNFKQQLKDFDWGNFVENKNSQGEAEAKALGLDEKEFAIYRNLLKEQSEILQGLSDEDYAKYVEGVNAASIANKRLERGVTDICKKWKDYDAIMKDSNAAIEDVSRVLADVNPAVQDMLNLSDKEFALLPPDFAKKHWDIINDVTEGVEGAADRLRDIAGKEILLKIAGDDTALQSDLIDLHNQLAEFDKEEYDIGIAINGQDKIYQVFGDLLRTGKMTAEQMQAYAKSMGYDVELKQEYTTTDFEVPEFISKGNGGLLDPIMAAEAESLSLSGKTLGYDVQTKKYSIKTPIFPPAVKVITPNGNYGGSSFVNKDGIPGSKSTGSSGSGKGGSSSKKETKTVERYKTVTDQIDKIKDSYSDVNKEADRLFGPKRWAEIEKSNKLLEKQNDLLEEKKKEAEDYFDQDQAALMGAAAAAGITFEFDADGIISNYREQMEAYYARYNSSEQTDEQKEILKKLEEALKQYEDTRKVLQDIQNEIDDNTRAIQDANNKILTERFNLKVEIRADQLKYIENQIKALGDDFFKRSEIFMLMANKMASYNGSNMTIDRSWYDQLIGQFNDIQNANISDADWLNNMKALKNEAQSAFDALIDWSKGMSTYYAETLSEFASGLDFFTKQLDHLNETIDHYRKTASLVGRDKDFQLLAKISEATLHNAIQQKEVKEAELALLERQKDTVLNTYNGPWSSEEDRNAYFQAAVKPILEQYQTVEKEVQALDEKILEANNQWAENKKNQALEIAEMALTAGKGFDQLNKSMDLASKTQDLLLTKTNQYYEIDKLLNDINKDIDKTDNLAAKQRYKNLADEISGLREKNQLSQFELKVAQAKYAQLQAQIALEEVQNAKSTVRLQRDNEGNYGYVYTADISQIEDAEQELRDKTNDLYNLYLEGANTTAQELLKLQQEFQDDLANIDWTAADAMQQAMELRKRYLEEVEILLSDHNIATTGLAELGAQGIQEAWTTEFFDPNIESLENWKDITDQEIEEITQVYQDWEDVIKDNTDVLDSLDNIDKELEVVKEEAERLNEQGQDYIDKSEPIINAIQNETDAWAKQYTQIQNLVQEYLNLTKAIDDTIDAKRREAIEEAERQQEEAKQITPVAPVTTNTTNTNSNNSNNTGNNGSNGTTQRVQRDNDTPLPPPKSPTIGGNWSGMGEEGNQEAPTPHRLRSYDRSGYTIYAYGLDDNHIAYYKIQGFKKTFYNLSDAYAYIDNLQNNKAGYGTVVLDTGGYTGSWGSDGRLAMLHEKELVLNKEDTKNFLAGVEILRSITGAIDLQAAAAGTATPISTPGFNLGGQTLQQSVTISAEFPNATNHSEIEEAFNNLINRASQYAHRQSFYSQV